MITVYGMPAPQGSKSFKGMRGGHAILVESSKKVKPWRDSVAWAAVESGEKYAGPVAVSIDFYLPRPTSTPKRVTVPAKKPDIDKLIRSTLDALVTAGVIEDDARVVTISAAKLFVGTPRTSIMAPFPAMTSQGCIINIFEVLPND